MVNEPGRTSELRQVLGFADGFGVSLSSMAPTFTIGIALGVLASIVGPSMPIVWVIAILPMIAIAGGFARLSARDVDCGTAYAWAGRYLSPWAGFTAGWLTVGGFVVFLAYAAQAAGVVTLESLSALGLVDASLASEPALGAAIGVAWFVGLALLAVRGVEIAAHLQKAIIFVDIVAVIGICGFALIKGGGDPISLSWFDPFAIASFGAFINGLVATVYLYWGWDNSLRLGEENKGSRSAGRAAMASLWLIVAVFVFCQVSLQHATTQSELVHNGANGLIYVANKSAGRPGEIIAALALLLSIVAIVQAIILATTRQTLAMGRDGVLGPVWARLHPRHGTPAAGTAILVVVVVVVVCANASLGSLSQVVNGAILALGLLATTYYAICGVAVAAAFRNTAVGLRERVVTIVLPLVSAAFLTALTLYAVVNSWRSTSSLTFAAANPRFQVLVAVCIAALGIPVALAARMRRSPYFFRVDEDAHTPILTSLR